MYTGYFPALAALMYPLMLINACSGHADKTEMKEAMDAPRGIEKAAEIVKRLEELGYLSYADPKDHESIRREMAEKLGKYGELSTKVDMTAHQSLDYRLHGLDNEDLFETGGFIDAINMLQPAFRKIGLTFTVNDYLDTTYADLSYSQVITINDKRYTVFDRYQGPGWSEAAKSFAEIVNEQLALQNSSERTYLIDGGNDGGIIFLTDAQFQYLDSVMTDPVRKPMRTDDWWNIMSGTD